MANEISLASHLIKIKDILRSQPFFREFKLSSISVDKNGSHLTITLPRDNTSIPLHSIECRLRIIPLLVKLTCEPVPRWDLLVETIASKYGEEGLFLERARDLKLVQFETPDLRLSIQTIQRSLLGIEGIMSQKDFLNPFVTLDPDYIVKEGLNSDA